MAKELERLKSSGGNAPPLWALEPEFIGMTNATRSYTLRSHKN
jgi:hypothetical protein